MPKSAPPLAGFSRASLNFFKDLEANNDRDWFTPRKAEYETLCVAPMRELLLAVNERLAKHAVEYVVPDVKKAIYRIYRDTRFSKDKTPYKTHIAGWFQRKGYVRHGGPGFYVQVSAAGLGVAGGIYMVEPDQVRAIRQAIAADPKAFEKLVTAKKVATLMGPLQGESLKRPPKGFESADSVYIRLKHWIYWKELGKEVVLSKDLPSAVTDRIIALLPFCEWIHTVLARSIPEEEKPKRPAPMF